MLINTVRIQMSFTYANERMVKNYMKSLQEKLIKKLKTKSDQLCQDSIIQTLFQILPNKQCLQCQNHKQPKDLMKILTANQQKIIDQQEKINMMKRKMQEEDQLTHSFFKVLMKERTKETIENIRDIKRQKESNPFSLLVSRCQDPQKIQSSITVGSPICDITRSRRTQTEGSASRYGVCTTSRSKMMSSRYQSSEFAMELELEEKDKAKALAKLRKLEKFVFEKENCGRRGSSKADKIWNFGISPTKRRVKEENQNLKVIQQNLVNHISILQKFRQVPSIQSLVYRQQQLKKREKILKEKQQQFQKRQINMNKKHSQFLKRQRSNKIL